MEYTSQGEGAMLLPARFPIPGADLHHRYLPFQQLFPPTAIGGEVALPSQPAANRLISRSSGGNTPMLSQFPGNYPAHGCTGGCSSDDGPGGTCAAGSMASSGLPFSVVVPPPASQPPPPQPVLTGSSSHFAGSGMAAMADDHLMRALLHRLRELRKPGRGRGACSNEQSPELSTAAAAAAVGTAAAADVQSVKLSHAPSDCTPASAASLAATDTALLGEALPPPAAKGRVGKPWDSLLAPRGPAAAAAGQGLAVSNPQAPLLGALSKACLVVSKGPLRAVLTEQHQQLKKRNQDLMAAVEAARRGNKSAQLEVGQGEQEQGPAKSAQDAPPQPLQEPQLLLQQHQLLQHQQPDGVKEVCAPAVQGPQPGEVRAPNMMDRLRATLKHIGAAKQEGGEHAAPSSGAPVIRPGDAPFGAGLPSVCMTGAALSADGAMGCDTSSAGDGCGLLVCRQSLNPVQRAAAQPISQGTPAASQQQQLQLVQPQQTPTSTESRAAPWLTFRNRSTSPSCGPATYAMPAGTSAGPNGSPFFTVAALSPADAQALAGRGSSIAHPPSVALSGALLQPPAASDRNPALVSSNCTADHRLFSTPGIPLPANGTSVMLVPGELGTSASLSPFMQQGYARGTALPPAPVNYGSTRSPQFLAGAHTPAGPPTQAHTGFSALAALPGALMPFSTNGPDGFSGCTGTVYYVTSVPNTSQTQRMDGCPEAAANAPAGSMLAPQPAQHASASCNSSLGGWAQLVSSAPLGVAPPPLLAPACDQALGGTRYSDGSSSEGLEQGLRLHHLQLGQGPYHVRMVQESRGQGQGMPLAVHPYEAVLPLRYSGTLGGRPEQQCSEHLLRSAELLPQLDPMALEKRASATHTVTQVSLSQGTSRDSQCPGVCGSGSADAANRPASSDGGISLSEPHVHQLQQQLQGMASEHVLPRSAEPAPVKLSGGKRGMAARDAGQGGAPPSDDESPACRRMRMLCAIAEVAAASGSGSKA